MIMTVKDLIKELKKDGFKYFLSILDGKTYLEMFNYIAVLSKFFR